MYEGIIPQVLVGTETTGVDSPKPDVVISNEEVIMDAQSGVTSDVMATKSASDNSNTALKFAEGLPGTEAKYMKAKDDTFNMIDNDEIGLHDFLSRPQRIFSTYWGLNNDIPFTTVKIMRDFLTNPRVANRVNNFAHLQCTVHVRVVVTGVPQMFGLAVASLNPWWNVDSTFTQKGGMGNPTINQLVQLPHVFIDPSTSTAGEITLPLILPFNALDLMNPGSVDECIALQLMSFTTLQSVVTTTQSAHISVWMWLSDVVLSNPTAQNLPFLSAQSGDEYGKQTISKSATTLAKLSNVASMVPVIAPYAKASEMAFNNLAALAELFGYSRPNSLKTEIPYQHKCLGNLTHANFEDSSTKLTLDSKAEVTVDPSVIGVQLTDEMSIASIGTREGYIGAMSWSINNGVSDIIGRMAVTPTICRTVTNTGLPPVVNDVLDMTPLTFVALPFRKWRGTIRFRIVVACSAFHKGRLRFTFDPKSTLGILSTGNQWAQEFNINQSHVMDLTESKEMVISVPWASNKSYLTVTQPGSRDQYDFTSPNTLGLTIDSNSWNGMLGVSVLTPLVAPDNFSSVRIMVFVSSHDDIEFQEPCNAFSNYTFSGWEPQSGEDLGADILTGNDAILYAAGTDTGVDVLGTMSKTMNEKLAMIHYGERILSVRQLIKRYVHHSIYRADNTTGGTPIVWRLSQNDFPSYKGWNPNALYTTVTGDKYNYARDSFLAYFTVAYLGRRGGIRQKYTLTHNAVAAGDLIITRNPNLTSVGITYTTFINVSNSQTASNIASPFDVRPGAAAVAAQFNNCCEVEMPFYSTNRFHFAKNLEKNVEVQTTDERFKEHFHHVQFTFMGGAANRQATLTRYVAAADDYQLVFFKYAPVCTIRSSPVPSALA